MHSLFIYQTSGFCSFCGLSSTMLFLHVSMHCGLIASEFNAFFTFKIKPACLVHFVVCLCHALFVCFNALWITRR